MRWVIASDHAGFALKERVREWLQRKGFDVTDLGVHTPERADYPDYGHRVGEAVGRGDFDRGVVVCGSGIGISIAANRHAGARAALCHEPWSATMARAHNDANVLALGARVIGEGMAEAVLDAFIAGPFEGGRHAERVAKIDGGA
jgi:ribose 5-phosphate isomerase B